jgi:8-oxo-dGTP diphosphatase
MNKSSRKEIRPKQVVAGLIVQDHREGRKVLICQRTKYQSMPLKWEFPGGKIETGEQPRAALKRELEEELGINATIGQEIARFRHQYASGSAVELRFYIVQEFTGEIENRIFKQVIWAAAGELLNHDFLEADIGLVRKIASGELLAT